MNQRFKIEYMEGDGGLEVVDLRDSTVAATLNAAGDVFEQNVRGNAEFLVCSAGRSGVRSNKGTFGGHADPARGSLGSDAQRAEQVVPGEGQPGSPDSLPPGAGEPGSSVPDVRIPESQTEPSPSSSDVPADRQAQNDAARTRNSPTTRR